MLNKQVIKAQNKFADVQDYVTEKAENEEGETFSYFVLVVGLIAAAIAVRPTLNSIIEGVAAKVGADALG